MRPEGTRRDLWEITQLFRAQSFPPGTPRTVAKIPLLPPLRLGMTWKQSPSSAFGLANANTLETRPPRGPSLIRLHDPERRNWGAGGGLHTPQGAPSCGQAGVSRLLLAGLAGRGGRQAPGARRPGAATERHVRRPDRAHGQQLRAGPGEVQYLNGPALRRAGTRALC